MKKFFLGIIFFAFLFSCQDDITVQIEKEPGSIAGQILPGILAPLQNYTRVV